ncbi:PTS sugar transporter subunit IIA [Saccharopolyspora sp. 6V]|uniref:PTS sugar transporter subunit IIA n=1 Tax=Saccharopolyspora sp. 6V TaxID=2877239 RepID=UPI001CD463FF|nr:PTS sugar transporter subunit IIA [Saccharopolyspora sp. 6V]MCA1192400.1 PTS sugar transporter subunit IIA [Saccharopolyspora sp. 6V]
MVEAGPPRPLAVRLAPPAAGFADAIDQCGRLLVETGAVEEPYVAAMHERERSLTTHLGEGVAIPHGTTESRRVVRRSALVVVQFPGGVRWSDGGEVSLCVAIAAGARRADGSPDAAGAQHLGVLSALATVLMDPVRARELREAPDEATVDRLLRSVEEDR